MNDDDRYIVFIFFTMCIKSSIIKIEKCADTKYLL
jgi:hypothetical protein